MKITRNLDALRATIAPVFCRYPHQATPQPAFIALDLRENTVSVDYSGEIGNAIPASVYHGLVRRVPISSYASGKALAEFLQSGVFTTLYYRIHDGFSTRYNEQGNHCGEFTQAGFDALHELERLAESHFEHEFNQSQVWQAGDYLQGIEERQPPLEPVSVAYATFGTVTADSTDDALQAMAAAITKDAADQGLTFDGTVLAYLEEQREECRKHAD